MHEPETPQSNPATKNTYFDFTGYEFRMPQSWPKSFSAIKPSFREGIGQIFQTSHMPMDARIGYWVWLIGCVLGILGWIFAVTAILFAIVFSPATLLMTGMVSFFGEVRWGVVLVYILTMVISLLIILLQLLLTLKIRTGTEWARMGLTGLTIIGIVYSIILTSADLESGGASTVVTNILSLLLISFFWMPKANAWFLQANDHEHLQ